MCALVSYGRAYVLTRRRAVRGKLRRGMHIQPFHVHTWYSDAGYLDLAKTVFTAHQETALQKSLDLRDTKLQLRLGLDRHYASTCRSPPVGFPGFAAAVG